MFDHIDIKDFWYSSSESNHHKLEPFSEEELREIQQKIGYKLPESYIALLRVQNGGCPQNTRVGDTGWEIDEFYGINKDNSAFWENEGEFYPKIGVPICTTTNVFDSFAEFLEYEFGQCKDPPLLICDNGVF